MALSSAFALAYPIAVNHGSQLFAPLEKVRKDLKLPLFILMESFLLRGHASTRRVISVIVIHVNVLTYFEHVTDRFSETNPFTQTLHEGIIPIDHALVIPDKHLIE